MKKSRFTESQIVAALKSQCRIKLSDFTEKSRKYGTFSFDRVQGMTYENIIRLRKALKRA